MKTNLIKISVLFFFTIITQTVAADRDRPVSVEQLPGKAIQFIKTHFTDEKISFAKMDSDWFEKKYEVFFTNGNKLEFDGKGNRIEVDCKYSKMPDGIVPAPIQQYVKTHFPDHRIEKITFEERRYEVELNGDIDIEFNTRFKVVDFDS